ncbi:hypothetical protein BDV96DRAFT_504467 [Lophiotrema nucula]|uniref:Peptidase S54 rhomboid domain-containing protein n=1 Tax=Lophiotrema nucula TaxID=690887 RepID=A0A6A5YR28_9PLEO|nr:hypothetical protein BDV96DRAFT_504467 [Lophiotrema nucula]
MSNALPAAFLRPSCAALRSTPVAHQWNSVTLAFARRFCSSTPSPRSSILSTLQPHNALISSKQSRPFSSSPRPSAKVNQTPEAPAPASQPRVEHQKKRVVRIGPLPTGDVDQRTLNTIFGPKVSFAHGNSVLRILHHRRTSGSLADYGVANLGSKYAYVNNDNAMKALDWLRKAFPIDEARAAEEWSEREANRIAYELWLADPENADSKYNDPARAFQAQQKQEAEDAEQQEQDEGHRIGLLRVGPSQFERNIKEKRRERLAEVTRKAEEKELKEKEDEEKIASGEWVKSPGGLVVRPGEKTYVDPFGREHVDRRDNYKKYYQEKAQSPFESEEAMLKHSTVLQRLYPMTAFVLLVCLTSYGIGHYYIPPDTSYRIWPDLSPTTATLCALVATNVLIAAAWRITPLWPLMTKVFLHVPGYPRAIQAVGNVFSHIQYEHLLSNLAFLVLVGSVCHDLVGRGVFLGTYVSAGAVGSLFTLYWANLGRGSISSHSVGASAAIWGIAALYCLLTERDRIKIPFSGEISFWPKVLFGAFVASEIWTIVRTKGRSSKMDHASHIGGILTGTAVAGYLRWSGFRANDGGRRVDLGAVVRQEAREVKDGVRKAVGGEEKK